MRRRGFTLIELLVSVAIISLLLSLLVPALSGARRQAQRLVCQTNLKQVITAVWAYSVANQDAVPWVESPMTNGGSSVPGFGNPAFTDAQVNPFDREAWPRSLQNMLMPLYLGEEKKVFVCPSATRGWPREGSSFEMSYRDAGVNQPNGVIAPENSYLRENFGFMDGRQMREFRAHFTGNPIVDGQTVGRLRATFLRDMIVRDGARAIGPHGGGINVIDQEFGVGYRKPEEVQEDLGTFGAGSAF